MNRQSSLTVNAIPSKEHANMNNNQTVQGSELAIHCWQYHPQPCDRLSCQSDRTVPGIGPGAWDSAILAREQETAAAIAFLHETKQSKDQSNAVLYRLYTENTYPIGKTQELIGRYFDGFTLYLTTGVYLGIIESGLVIEVVATTADLQAIVHLAGDIKVQNYQSSVLITWASVSRLDV